MAVAFFLRGERVTDDTPEQMVRLKGAREPLALNEVLTVATYLLLEQVLIAQQVGDVRPEDTAIRLELAD